MTEQEAKLIAYWVEGEFPAAIWITRLGSLDGYLGVPPSHPWYGQHYDDVDCDVHGGLTYSEHETFGHPAMLAHLKQKIKELEKSEVPAELKPIVSHYERGLIRENEHTGESRKYPYETGLDVWWFGFDCAHYGDLVPGMAPFESSSPSPDIYRDEEYVRKEITGMAQQAAEAARKEHNEN